MINIETYFFQDQVIVLTYNSYIDGLSPRDIAFKLELIHNITLTEDQIDNIIDLINTIIA